MSTHVSTALIVTLRRQAPARTKRAGNVDTHNEITRRTVAELDIGRLLSDTPTDLPLGGLAQTGRPIYLGGFQCLC
jgi:hypothetical protein